MDIIDSSAIDLGTLEKVLLEVKDEVKSNAGKDAFPFFPFSHPLCLLCYHVTYYVYYSKDFDVHPKF